MKQKRELDAEREKCRSSLLQISQDIPSWKKKIQQLERLIEELQPPNIDINALVGT